VGRQSGGAGVLLGTPYFPQVDGGILFIEDVGEHPYRIERMLTQLLLAGVLQKQKAIVFGQFTEFKLTTHDKGFKLQTVIDWLRMQLKRPVLQGLPFGHVPTRCCCPWGAGVAVCGRTGCADLLGTCLTADCREAAGRASMACALCCA
jgi:muramoyltetrapeptide carboxypeptidase